MAIVASAEKQLEVESTGDEQEVEQPDATNWPDLSSEQQHIARKFVSDKDHNFAVVLAAYETKDVTMFPEIAFNKSMINLSSSKYWNYICQIAVLEPVQRFCSMMKAIFSCPPSSAGIERLFSSAALVHTKLRNRLANDRVAKLVRVYRYFGWKEKVQKDLCPYPQKTDDEHEDDIEFVANLV